MRSDLATLAKATQALSRAAIERPCARIAWLPLQLDFLRHGGRQPSLLRLGQRQGKSYAGAADLIYRALGKHPYKAVKSGPVKLAMVNLSKSQSLAIQQVLWELLPKGELAPGTRYNFRTGFGGHHPIVEFRNGSTIRIYSNAQGREVLSGHEFDHLLLDEPPLREVYDEALARTRNTGGSVALTLTPIGGGPLPWLRELVERGIVREYHAPLTVESQISPITGLVRRSKDGRLWDAAFIDELRRTTNPIDAPILIDGEWESRVQGQFFRCFDPAKHVTPCGIEGQVVWVLGVDYAAADREYGQTAILAQVQQTRDEQGRTSEIIYVVAEVITSGVETTSQFAKRIVSMLQDVGLRWHQIKSVYGDNPVQSRWATKSNIELQKAIVRELGIPYDALRPRILSVKEKQTSKELFDSGCRYLYERIASGSVRIHPRCTHLVKALQEWDYSASSKWKDAIDALRYSLRDYIMGGRRQYQATYPIY